MAPMKRKATFAKRAAKRSRHTQLVPTVVAAIAGAETLPLNLRSLLKQTLPIVLTANKVDRHAYEAEVVDQAQQALTAAQAAIEQQHKAALAVQNDVIAPAECNKRSAAMKAAEGHLEAVKAKLEADKAARKSAEKAEEDAEDALKAAKKDGESAIKVAKKEGEGVVKAAQKEENDVDKELHHQVTKKATLTNSLTNEFTMVKDGTSASAAGKKAVQTLLKLGKEYGLGGTLLSTLPFTCKKPAASRTDFENEVFTRYEALINNQINALTEKIAEAEATKGAKAAATAAAQAALEAATAAAEGALQAATVAAQDVLEKAKAALKAAETELEATQNAHKEAGKEVSKADKARRQIWNDMMHACDAQDKLAKDLKHFQETVWAAFNQLKEKEPEPEPVEEPVEEPAAPAEVVPEAAVAAPVEG